MGSKNSKICFIAWFFELRDEDGVVIIRKQDVQERLIKKIREKRNASISTLEH